MGGSAARWSFSLKSNTVSGNADADDEESEDKDVEAVEAKDDRVFVAWSPIDTGKKVLMIVASLGP